MSIKPYPHYKDSEVPWVDKIPDSWALIRNKQLFQPRKEIVGDMWSDYDLLSLTLNGIVKRDLVNPKGKFPAEFNTYQIVKEKDFVFCLFDVDETPRTIGVSPYHGMITGAYTVFESKFPNSKFLYYYYLHLDNHKALKPIYTGLRKVIPEDRFLRVKTPFPSLKSKIR
jgi:type I restriction enzyme, S subunit